MVYLYCMTLSDWFTLIGAIASVGASVVALWIAFFQERKNRKRIEEENKNIGETICALLEQFEGFITLFIKKGYQVCIDKLEKDDVSIPEIKLIPMAGIKKLEKYSPDILYRVFNYYKLTDKDYQDFVISIDIISNSVEVSMQNYEDAVNNAVKLINEFQEVYKKFNIMVFHWLQNSENEEKTANPVYIKIGKILKDFGASKESDDYGNIRYRQNALVNRITKTISDKKNDSDLMNIYIIALNLETIYKTLQATNKSFADSLKEIKVSMESDIDCIMEIHNKLEERCK